MGKKGLAGAVLAGVVLRLAVMAGAGEALGNWVRSVGGEGSPLSATVSVSLGTDKDRDEPSLSAEETSPAFLLVAVTPAPEETPAPETAFRPTEQVQAANLSGSAAVHNSSDYTLDLTALAAEGLSLTLPREGPQVLILHTHSSEAYTPEGTDQYEASDPYRTEDKTRSVIRVGDALAAKLEAAGLTVLHDREIYDYPSYTGSYNRSGAAVAQYLADYPSLRVVIDLHRDALGSGDVVYKTEATVGGRASAQVMLLAGTGANGLSHPAWRENLKLALYLQNAMDGKYPRLARPVEVVNERYNQQLSAGMLILEVGSSGNTLREALTAAELFGDAAGPALAALME